MKHPKIKKRHEKPIEINQRYLDGKLVNYLDVLKHTTSTKFKWKDRIRILFGGTVVTHSDIYTLNYKCKVVGCEARVMVEPMFGRRRARKQFKAKMEADTKPKPNTK